MDEQEQKRIEALLELYNSDNQLLKMDGFDDCIAGVCARYGQAPIIAYDYRKVIAKLMREQDMDYDEANEWFDFNMIGAWRGDGTPCFIITRTHE